MGIKKITKRKINNVNVKLNHPKQKNKNIEKVRKERTKKDQVYENLTNIDKDGFINLNNKENQLSKEDEDLFKNIENLTKNQDLLNNINNKINIKNEEIKKKEMEDDISKNPKVIAVYTKIAEILSTYRNGKLPKSLHILPSIENWESIIKIIKPETWTPHAIYQLIKIFISVKESEVTSIFFSKYLLPMVRQNFKKYKKIHGVIYSGLIKAFYRPKSWLKGILFSLLNQDLTNKEAQIFCSILQKSTIPNIHAGVSLHKILSSNFNGTNTLFLKAILSKKISLPKMIIDQLLIWFFEKIGLAENLPILFFQTLLIYIKYYDQFINKIERAKLKKLVKSKCTSKELYNEINDTLNKINEKEYKEFKENKMFIE